LRVGAEQSVPRILVVDDDAAIRESIRLALAPAGIEVTTVDSGERALEDFAHASFDGAIVDFMMPGIGGAETIRALRALRPGLPVIVVSGSLMRDESRAPDFLHLAMELAGVTHLAKPFKLSDLLRTVRASLDAAKSA
jgi:CheY-like chemotaxis protein